LLSFRLRIPFFANDFRKQDDELSFKHPGLWLDYK